MPPRQSSWGSGSQTQALGCHRILCPSLLHLLFSAGSGARQLGLEFQFCSFLAV